MLIELQTQNITKWISKWKKNQTRMKKTFCTQPFNLQKAFWTLYRNMLPILTLANVFYQFLTIVQIINLCTSVLTWWYVKRKPLISKVCFCYWCMLSVSFLKLLSSQQNLWSVLPEGFRPVLNQNSAPLCMVHCTA